ncbi:MAG: ribonuclease HI [Clostridiales bacterium]|nr:ribonuclease HI [Clostridiales bacterium]
MKQVDIYTDGACSRNPGPGGWGCVLLYGEHEREASGFVPETTNNRMEMQAAIEALTMLKEPCQVRLHSDSAYLCNGFNEGWVYNWLRSGWKTSNKKDVENIDLWQRLLELTRKHKVQFVKVRGHADNLYNNRCDALARAAITENRPGKSETISE